MTTQNRTLGRGEIHFGRFKTGTQVPDGERYFGNTPSFNTSTDIQSLDHYDSDHGIKEKDDSIPLQTNRSASFETDNIAAENVALSLLGETLTITQTSATVTAEHHDGVKQGYYYQLGTSSANPAGVRDLDDVSSGVHVTVTDDAGSPQTFVNGDDYTIDMTLGRLFIVEGGAIDDGKNLRVTYKKKAGSWTRIISGNTPIEGTLRFIADNPVGDNQDYFYPWVKLTPNGDYNLKGDEWLKMSFKVEILKRTGYEACYVDGRPLVGG